MTYENLAKFPCYGCEYATITNHYIPVFWCDKRHKYVKKCFKKCKDREDGHPSNIQWYEEQHKLGRF